MNGDIAVTHTPHSKSSLLLRRREAARRLAISVSQLDRLVRCGQIEVVRFGRNIRFHPSGAWTLDTNASISVERQRKPGRGGRRSLDVQLRRWRVRVRSRAATVGRAGLATLFPGARLVPPVPKPLTAPTVRVGDAVRTGVEVVNQLQLATVAAALPPTVEIVELPACVQAAVGGRVYLLQVRRVVVMAVEVTVVDVPSRCDGAPIGFLPDENVRGPVAGLEIVPSHEVALWRRVGRTGSHAGTVRHDARRARLLLSGPLARLADFEQGDVVGDVVLWPAEVVAVGPVVSVKLGHARRVRRDGDN
jgi:excisionase family DNA binding protein